MARDGNPDDEFYGEPTQYADYSGGGQAYSEYPQQPEYGSTGYGYPTGQTPTPQPPEPWYRKPAGLVVLGALGVVITALVIYAIVSLIGGSSDTTPTGGTTTVTTTAPTTNEAPATVTATPAPGSTDTVTVSPTATEAPQTTTEAPATTTPSPEVSTSTVTETVTKSRPRLTLFPRPTAPGGDGQ